MNRYLKQTLLALALSSVNLMGAQAQAAEPDPDAWLHSVSIYAWLPTVDGTLKYQRDNGDSMPIDASQILDALNMTVMGTYEGRRDKLFILGDFVYLDLGQNKDRDVLGYSRVEMNLNGWQLGLYGGYNLSQSERYSFEPLAGLRYLSIDTETNLFSNLLPDLSLNQKVDLLDGIVGFRGRISLNENWFIPYHADVGTGESDLTWQVMTGAGYRADWGDILLVYRHLQWDQGDDELLQNLSFSGPAVAFKYHF